MAEKKFRAEIPDGTHLDLSRETTGAYRGTLRDEQNRLVGHAELHEIDDGDSDDEEFALGGALAGLALVGLTIGVAAAVGSVREKKARRRQEEARVVSAQPAAIISAPAGWYDIGSGRQRWWDGQAWTEHFQADPRSAAAPAGWYDDGSGRQRWWDGQAWTGHFQADPRSVAAPAGWYDDGSGRQRWWDGVEWTAHFEPQQAIAGSPSAMRPHDAAGGSSRDVDVAVGQPQITMSSAEWQKRVRAMLLARAISEQQWRLLSIARIEDAGNELLAWQQQLASLTPQQFSDQLNIALESDPALAGASLQLAQAGWYDDGSGRGARWWDGVEWTEHYQPELMPARSAAPVNRRW